MGRETEELVSPPKSAITISAGFECLELFYKNNVDLYLCYCGIEDCSKGHSFGPTVRNEYLIHYILSGKGSYQAGGHSYVEHILNYIEKNYKKEIRVSQLAKEMGLSRSYLSSCFKKTTGQTVQDYLMSLRMEKAEILLTSTATPIREIASEVGYEDSLAFSKTFKKKMESVHRSIVRNMLERRRNYKWKTGFDRVNIFPYFENINLYQLK